MLMTQEEQQLHDRQEEAKKYYAARFAWENKSSFTPKGVTWADWFKNMFGESLDAYAERMKQR